MTQTRTIPMCPHCRANLVQAIAHNKRTCPSCEQPFTLETIHRAAVGGAKEEAVGFVPALLMLAIRAVIVFAAWFGLLYVTHPLVTDIDAFFDQARRGGLFATLMAGLIALLPGALAGWVCAKGINDRIGFDGMIVFFIVAAFVIAALLGAAFVVQTMLGNYLWFGSAIVMATIMFALIVTLKMTVFDE